MKAHYPGWDIAKDLKTTFAEIHAAWMKRISGDAPFPPSFRRGGKLPAVRFPIAEEDFQPNGMRMCVTSPPVTPRDRPAA